MITKSLIDADVRALTLLNPWAFCITHHGKRVENRTWSPPQSLDTFLIHAGQRDDRAPTKFLRSIGVDPLTPHEGSRSAIIAVARLAHVCSATVGHPGVLCDCGNWAVAGQYHWHIGDLFVLPTPVPCRGFQKLWKPTPAALEAVKEQI